jgi:NADH dehydrogenase
MILVAGSTGKLGSEISRLLAKQGRQVRTLVRATSDKETVRTLSALGAEIVEGDVRDAASVAHACKGITTVVSTISSMPTRYVAGENDIARVDAGGVKTLIDASRKAGVERFVFISFTMDSRFPLRDAKREAEKNLTASGMTWTIFRPSFFMETWLGPMVGFDYEKATARLCGTGENPVSYVSLRDVASIAASSLEKPSAKNALIPIGGPEAISQKEAVEIFEETEGRKFAVEFVPEAAIAAQQKGATDPMQQSFAALMLGLAAGDQVEMKNTAKEYGIHLKSVREYAREVLPQTVSR